MTLFRGYVGAHSCTGGPQVGVERFQAVALRVVPESRSDGIYNCRPVRGSTRTTSLHGEGRAFDWGCKAGAAWARTAADLLVGQSKQLGIQCVIYNRRIWSGAHPDSGWRSYSGVDSHTTHLHIEFSWASALGLTTAQATRYLAPLQEDDMPTAKEIADAIRPLIPTARATAEALASMPVGSGEDSPGNLGTALYRTQSELMRVADQIANAAELQYAIAKGDTAARDKAIARIRARDIKHPGEPA